MTIRGKHGCQTLNCLASESGQGLVEIALTFSMILMLVLGVADFGLVIRDYISVVDAASAGAAAVSRGEPVQDAAHRVTNGWRCQETGGTPTVSETLRTGKTTVTVTCTVSDVAGLFGPFRLTHSATGRKRVSP